MEEPIHNKSEHSVLIASLAPLVTVVIWSGNTVVTKAASGLISPGSISLYRWSIAFLLLLPFVGRATWSQRRLVTRSWWKLAVLGALGMVIYQSLAYVAAATTSAVNMGVIQALMPLTSAMFAAVLASERLTTLRLVGGAISLGGLIYLTSRGQPSQLLSGGLHLGDGLMLVAVFANSLYGVLLRRWELPLNVAATLLPDRLRDGLADSTLVGWTDLADHDSKSPLILYAAIPTSLVAPLCWMVSIKRLGAARTALFINLLPVIVALLAWGVLGEQLRTNHLIGGALALAGSLSALAARHSEKISNPSPQHDTKIEPGGPFSARGWSTRT